MADSNPKPDGIDHKTVDPTVVQQYKLAVEMADRVSARRTTTNSFFATLHAALLTALGAVFVVDADTGSRTNSEIVAAIGVALAGLALTAAWYLALRSYRDLNSAKFKVIQEIEKKLPVAVFADEWDHLKKDPVKKWRGRYAELGTTERTVPLAFALLYMAAGLFVFFG